MFKQCLDSELIPIIIRDDRKLLYYHALHAAQVDKDYTELTNFCKDEQSYYYNFIKDYFPEKEIGTRPPSLNQKFASTNSQKPKKNLYIQKDYTHF